MNMGLGKIDLEQKWVDTGNGETPSLLIEKLSEYHSIHSYSDGPVVYIAAALTN